MLGQNYLRRYRSASLPVKISLPLILVSLGVWTTGTLVLGQYFSRKLDQGQEKRAADLAALVEREIQRELTQLRNAARLLTVKGAIVEGTAEQDVKTLQKTLIPLGGILRTDISTLLGRDRRVILDFRKPVLDGVELSNQSLIDLMLTGSAVSTITSSIPSGPPVLVGTAPIKDSQGVIGGILLGTALSNELLDQINDSIDEQIVVVADNKVISSTFPKETAYSQSLMDLTQPTFLRINRRAFLAQPIVLKGLDGKQFNLILLISQQPLARAKKTLWSVILLVSSLGSGLTTIIGYGVARRIANPIQAITEVANQVVRENNFELRANADTQDEINRLAKALNQLIEWVGQYTYELEAASQTLESRVEDRTKELAKTLQELQDTQLQLIQTEKMSSLGEMVAGIAHEINNPISFVQGNLEPLNEYLSDLVDLIELYDTQYDQPTDTILQKQQEIDLDFVLDDLPKLLGSIKMGTKRVRDIVVSLRNFARLDEAIVKDVDIHDGIESTLLLLNHRLKYDVEVIKNYGPLPPAKCSPAQLNQVFTNIIVNALDAMSDTDCESKQIIITTRVVAIDNIQISIRDNGPGIPPEVRSKIFDPFFTTKPVGKGTGMGLGICFRILEHHRGNIEVKSELHQGTEFIITFPKDALPLEPVAA